MWYVVSVDKKLPICLKYMCLEHFLGMPPSMGIAMLQNHVCDPIRCKDGHTLTNPELYGECLIKYGMFGLWFLLWLSTLVFSKTHKVKNNTT